MGTGQWTGGDVFSGVRSVGYRSSSSRVDNPVNAWVVLLSGVFVFVFDKFFTFTVWPVRGGQ